MRGKKFIIKYSYILVVALVLTLTIGYSAFSNTLSIGNSLTSFKIISDIRITEVTIENISDGAVINDFFYGSKSIIGSMDITQRDSGATFKITVINFNNAVMGLASIYVSDGFQYTVDKDVVGKKLCDKNDPTKCSLGSVTEFNITISYSGDVSSPMTVGFNVGLDFKEVLSVNYTDVEGTEMPTYVLEGNSLTAKVERVSEVLENGVLRDFDFSNGTLTVSNVTDNLEIVGIQTLYKLLSNKAAMDNTNSEFVSAATGINFAEAPSNTNGKGVYTVSSTKNDQYPVHYYRGEVTDNNLKFAGFCWKIVRTTETGGVKLIYNGVPTVDGTCNNTGEASQLTNTSAFNSNFTSPTDAGYMYGTRYAYSSRALSSQADTYIYGNDVTWDGTSYTLVDTIESSSWSTDRENLAKRHHYTCFSTGSTCTSVYYINYFGDLSTAYYLTLTGGKNIETAKEDMFTNTTDSTIKTVIDSWYSQNMTGYTSKIEDTVWCNDRSIYSGSLKSKDTDAGIGYFYFGAYGRNISNIVPSLSCSNEGDRFKVNGENVNEKLTYPVGLLTADEITLAGSGNKGYSSNSYLNTGHSWFSLSPCNFYGSFATSFVLNSSGRLSSSSVDYGMTGVRPSVSLKYGTKILEGTGRENDPYIVE